MTRAALGGVVLDRVHQAAKAHHREEHRQQRRNPDDD
jgi:hypothetical protein